MLVTELIHIAKHCGLRRLEAEVNGERKIALAVLAQLWFQQTHASARLRARHEGNHA